MRFVQIFDSSNDGLEATVGHQELARQLQVVVSLGLSTSMKYFTLLQNANAT
jgi:hypothetical protein